jgi:signal transduction histidine kinase
VSLVVRESGPAWAQADARAAARIVRALLENALRHGSRPGGTITVEVEQDGENVAVRVGDDGVGVPADERERIFGRFERGAQAGTGFGLGLPIARGLARRMGGDVVAVDAERGACFVATLPALAHGPVVDGLVGVHELAVANGHLP